MTLNQRRFEVLRRVEHGELSIEEGSRLLADLEAGVYEEVEALPPIREPAPAAPMPPAARAEPVSAQPEVLRDGLDEDAERRMKRWQQWWVLPFAIGLVITILGAVWMFQGYIAAGFGWRFWLSWFPFAFGLLLVVASWYSRSLPWLHVRVRDGSTNVNLSLPVPIGLANWGLARYKRYAPDQYEKAHMDEVMTVVNETLTQDAPMHVVVDDDDSHVEVIITTGRGKA